MENQVSPGFLDFIGRFQILFREKIQNFDFRQKKIHSKILNLP